MARRRPGESFLGPKGSKLWSSEPRTLAPASSPYVHTWLAFWLYTVYGHVTSITENICSAFCESGFLHKFRLVWFDLF